MGEVSDRASLARWKWKADKARADLSATFAARGRQLPGQWCDFRESKRLSRRSERLGPSPDRVIHRWRSKHQFIEAFRSCGSAIGHRAEHVYVLIMDMPDAAWIRMRADRLLSELAYAAEWLTDGFIVFDPETESLLSVDVVELHGVSLIETTLIGETFGELRGCFTGRGSQPLAIVDQSRHAN